MTHPRAWLERRRARAKADYWIRHGLAASYPWRVDELTSTRERKLCARSLRSVLDELEGTKLPGAAPLRTASLRGHAALLEAIEARLLDQRPVAARGMLRLNDLLTGPGSCLFAPVDEVEPCLRAVLETLEAR